MHRVRTMPPNDAPDSSCADMIGRELRLQIANALIRRSHPLQQLFQQLLIALSRSIEERWLDANSLLIDMPAQRHRSRTDAAHVRMVRAIGGIADDVLLMHDRRDERDVGQ